MANRKHFEHLKQGVKRWNQWREENPGEKPDLEGADFEGADLEEVNLEEANLVGVNLKWANLREADLTKADLTKADLRMADLEEAHLRGADLERADLRGTILVETDFQGASLINTNFSEANITGAQLYRAVRDGWIIDGITCAYVFWDREGKKRSPVNRDFRLGEFEELYKHPQPLGTTLSTVLHHVMHLF